MVLLKSCSLNLQNILTKTSTAVINFGKVLCGGYFAVNFLRILGEVFNETTLRDWDFLKLPVQKEYE